MIKEIKNFLYRLKLCSKIFYKFETEDIGGGGKVKVEDVACDIGNGIDFKLLDIHTDIKYPVVDCTGSIHEAGSEGSIPCISIRASEKIEGWTDIRFPEFLNWTVITANGDRYGIYVVLAYF